MRQEDYPLDAEGYPDVKRLAAALQREGLAPGYALHKATEERARLIEDDLVAAGIAFDEAGHWARGTHPDQQ